MQFTELIAAQHDHDSVRQSLGQLRVATSCTTPPPPGHVFWSILLTTARDLAGELPHHMAQEEALLFTLIEAEQGVGVLAGLRAEHQAIITLLGQLTDAVDALEAAKTQAAWGTWAALCGLAHQLEVALDAHMVEEEQVLRTLARGGSLVEPGCGEASA